VWVWLFVPVAVWAALGLTVLVTFRRAGTTWLLRVAAAFLALWAVLATTALVWVLTDGGWHALQRLSADPLLILQARFTVDWVAGGLGAFGLLLAAFALNQLVGLGWWEMLAPRPLAWPRGLPRPSTPTVLAHFASPRTEAFSFTLVRRDPAAWWGFARQEVVLVSDALLERLTPVETEAALAHELGHLRALDGRYLTFVRTFSRLVRWDPVVWFLSASLTRREEVRADRIAVQLTGRPRALARAIYKASQGGLERPIPPTAWGILGSPAGHGRSGTEERIRRLLELAEVLEPEDG
jgi:Zn-dependent protease with chaperone function